MPGSETVATIPIITGTDGVIRVSGTRVTLDSILFAFHEGATAEEIAQKPLHSSCGCYRGHPAAFRVQSRRRMRSVICRSVDRNAKLGAAVANFVQEARALSCDSQPSK